MNRRDFIIVGAGSLAALSAGMAQAPHAGPRLRSRPRKPRKTFEAGLHVIGLSGGERDGLCYVPASFNADAPTGLLLALHGATQSARVMIGPLTPMAEALGCPILAPDSRGVTWDAIRGDYDVDVDFIDRALAWAFDRGHVDSKRVWLSGFSDGASYGLGLGLANGDLFNRVMAFSPGFVAATEPSSAKPRIFVSHGTADPILPIGAASRMIVPMLKDAGYDVRYEEFNGGHRMPPDVVKAATDWLKA